MNMKIIGVLLMSLSLNAYSSDNIGTETVITGIYTYGEDNGHPKILFQLK